MRSPIPSPAGLPARNLLGDVARFVSLRSLASATAERAAVDAARRLGVALDHLIGAGLTNKDIARQLEFRLRLSSIHVHDILDKLQLTRRSQVTRWVRDNRQSVDRRLAASRPVKRNAGSNSA